jgi:hypothetical protein
MANLPATPDRGEQRGRSYVGVMGAMATQWMPVVMEYIQSTSEAARGTRTAAEMVEMATDASRRRNTLVCFCMQSLNGEVSYFVEETSGRPPAPSPSLGEDDWALLRPAAVKGLGEAFAPPSAWRRELAAVLSEHPKGQYHLLREGEGSLEDVAVWVVDLPPEDARERPEPADGGARYQWVSSAHALRCADPPLRKVLEHHAQRTLPTAAAAAHGSHRRFRRSNSQYPPRRRLGSTSSEANGKLGVLSQGRRQCSTFGCQFLNGWTECSQTRCARR